MLTAVTVSIPSCPKVVATPKAPIAIPMEPQMSRGLRPSFSTFVPMFNMHITEGDDFGHWFTYGLYGIICLIAALFVWRLVPETKGKTLEDMTSMWKNRLMHD